MISYKPSDWLNFLFSFHKSDTFRQLGVLMIALGLYAYGVRYVEKEYFHIDVNSEISKLTILHTILGTVMSLLLVFRTNTAYDRWWEGRKLWGSLVNNSRNLAIKLNAYLSDEDDRSYFRKLIPTFSEVLANHLMNEEVSLMLFEGFDLEIDHHKHKPNQVASLLFQRANNLYRAGKITGEQFIILSAELQSFTDICGACERIKNTPIPYSYNAFIKKFIFFFVMTLPFGFAFNLGYLVVPVVVFIFYVLASLELIAEEIEDPFGRDANDLPIEKISSNIKKHIEEIL